MEEAKVSELPVASTVNDDDIVMIVQNGFNKQITKENLFNDTEQNIEDLQTNLTNLETQISDLVEYTTDEIAVGKWIDGKTIYRKVFTGTNTTNISTGITPDNIIKLECLTHQSGGSWRTIPWLYSMNDAIGSGAWAGGFYFNDSDSTIRFQLGSNLAALKIPQASIDKFINEIGEETFQKYKDLIA